MNVVFEGYAGNQPRRGTKFSTGGSFYYSEERGPNVSASVSLGNKIINLSVNIGKVTNSSGIIVDVPNNRDYFKVHVAKTYIVQNFKLYKRRFDESTWSYVWEPTGGGYTSKIHDSTVTEAKKVQ